MTNKDHDKVCKAKTTRTEYVLLTVVGGVLLMFFLWLLANYPGCAGAVGGVLLLGVFPAIFNFLNDLSKKE